MSSTTDYQPAAPTQQPAGIATASLVLGIVGFFVGVCSVIGLVLGLVARGKARRGEIGPARVKAGIIVSSVTLALNALGIIILVALMAGGAASTTTPDVESAAAATVSEAPVEIIEPTPTSEAPVPVEASQVPVPVEVTQAPAPSQSTTEAAEPAEVAAPASAVTVSQKNALRSAEDYLDYSAFSRSGLIDQLEYEGFSTEDATYGVDQAAPDYNEQAAKAAKQYLEYSSFSRSGLIDQLQYEGYTAAEAEFGASQAGL